MHFLYYFNFFTAHKCEFEARNSAQEHSSEESFARHTLNKQYLTLRESLARLWWGNICWCHTRRTTFYLRRKLIYIHAAAAKKERFAHALFSVVIPHILPFSTNVVICIHQAYIWIQNGKHGCTSIKRSWLYAGETLTCFLYSFPKLTLNIVNVLFYLISIADIDDHWQH